MYCPILIKLFITEQNNQKQIRGYIIIMCNLTLLYEYLIYCYLLLLKSSARFKKILIDRIPKIFCAK